MANSSNSRGRILTAPIDLWRSCRSHRELLLQFTRRGILGRYRGSFIGLLWSFLNPLLMLMVYSLVFGVLLRQNWGEMGTGAKGEFVLGLFAGLSLFNLFTETVTSAPSLIVNNTNYVKKVVFPLEIFPVSLLGESLFHGIISFGILFLGQLVFLHTVQPTVVLLPVVILPVLILTLGTSFLLAGLGVFIRDVQFAVAVLTTVLLFMSAVFYPLAVVPESLQGLFLLNPMAVFVENCRRVVMWGMMPDWGWMLYATGVSILVFFVGVAFFEATKKSFADVL
jgi:lipopolysaccharide transport system permease protein